MTKKTILICGASIAGPCVAYWLARQGHSVTVVEKSAKLSDGGQNVDIKGAAQQVVDLMGLKPLIKAASVQEVGLQFVDAEGKATATLPKTAETSFTSEIEILRGDLARVFYDATTQRVDYRFGVTVARLVEQESSMHVVFSDGAEDDFELVICAEGIGSSTRDLIMKDEVAFEYLGLNTSFFRIPREPHDDNWARWYNAPGGRVIVMRPATDTTQSVTVTFTSEDDAVAQRSAEDHRHQLRQLLDGAGWQSERIIRNLEFDDEIWFGPLSQVKATHWSKGRFVLLGDAGYCPTPVAGIGTTLAIVGAYVLAGELATQLDYETAFKNYDRILRPYVERGQKLPPGVPRLVYPQSELGVAVLNTAAGVFASDPVQWLVSLLPHERKSKGEDDFVLPDYPAS